MTSELPDSLQYTREHEWVRQEGEVWVVGITRFASDQLGDVVFVELPQVGTTVTAGQPFGVVESVKSVSDLFAPVTGQVTAVNDSLREHPEKVNEDPYGQGWMIQVAAAAGETGEGLLSAQDYGVLLAAGH